MDWYRLQQKYMCFDEISPDAQVLEQVKGLGVNTDFAHNNLKTKLHNTGNDVFLITDIEISKKLPLEQIVKLVKRCYNKCNKGVYVSLLSYWITPKHVDKSLPDSYANSIRIYFQEQFDFANTLQDISISNDNSMRINANGVLEEGQNFIFVHPNIRYWLWK